MSWKRFKHVQQTHFATSFQTILPRTVVIDPFSSDTIQLIRTWCRAFSLIGPIQQFSRNLFRNHTIQLACRRRPEKPKSCSVRPGKNEPPGPPSTTFGQTGENDHDSLRSLWCHGPDSVEWTAQCTIFTNAASVSFECFFNKS